MVGSREHDSRVGRLQSALGSAVTYCGLNNVRWLGGNERNLELDGQSAFTQKITAKAET